MLTPLRVPASTTRIAVYLRPEDVPGWAPCGHVLSPFAWIRHLNRVVAQTPVVFAGEEPALYSGFYTLLEGLRPDMDIEIETALGFDFDDWLQRVPPERFDAARPAPVFRARFDPRSMDADEAIERALLLQGAGFSISLRVMLVPTHKAEALGAAERARAAGLDAATEPFFGRVDGRLFGQYTYRSACLGAHHPVTCRSTQVLIAPDGGVFGCHHHLLAGVPPVAWLSEDHARLALPAQPCDAFGDCEPRDVAVTVDQRGHLVRPPVEITPRRRQRRAAS